MAFRLLVGSSTSPHPSNDFLTYLNLKHLRLTNIIFCHLLPRTLVSTDLVHGTLNSPPPCRALNYSGHSCHSPILLLTTQILPSSGNPEFFSPMHLKYYSQQKLILQSSTFFILNFLLVILNAVTTSPITCILATSNYEEYIFTGKSSTYTKVWQSHLLPYPVQSVSSLYSTQVSTIHHV